MLSRRLLIGGLFLAWTHGTLTPDNTPVTILDDTKDNSFPGIARLDDTRALLVYRRATSHLAGGEVYGKIGTITGTSVSWGTAFLIYTNAEDVRLEDAVSVIDDKIVITARLYNGTINHDPFILICDDDPASFTSSSTWGSPIAVNGGSSGVMIGRVQKVTGAGYLVGYNYLSGGVSATGVLLNSSLDDWSSPTLVPIGTGANTYNEIDVEIMPSGVLVAHIRMEASKDHYIATSSDHGATWTSPTMLFDGWGYPAWRRLPSGMLLAVYRQSSNDDTYWRQSADSGTTWSSETLLDGTPDLMAYATFLQLDSTNVLCVYGIENAGLTDSNLYSQVFTDSSTPP